MKQLTFFLIFLILISCSNIKSNEITKIKSNEIKSDLSEIMDFNKNYTFDEYLKVLRKIDISKEFPNPNDIYIK